MFKEANVMFIYTETSLHCGSGTNLGVIDLPIQRERHTDYPVCQASGIKGVTREWFEVKAGGDEHKKKLIKYVFGPDYSGGERERHAGASTFTDGRLLLFPVRALNGVFAFTTSRFALSRLKRDLLMAGIEKTWTVPPESEKIAGVKGCKLANSNNKIVLEEYAFDFEASDSVAPIAGWIADNAVPKGAEYEYWRNKVKNDLLILPDAVFKDFVKNSTEVQARIRINNETKTVDNGALFYEEALPSDSLLYSVVMTHDPACDSKDRPAELKNSSDVMKYIQEIHGQRLQFGGDTTIGRGIVNINFIKREA